MSIGGDAMGFHQEGNIAVYDLFDAEGQQVLHSVRRKKSTLGGGWVAFYKKRIRQLIVDCPNFATFKVYMMLASKQTYQKFVIITTTKLAELLNLNRSTVSESLTWLQNNGYLQRHKVDGVTGWLLNAKVTICGAVSKPSKEELWDLTERRNKIDQLDVEISKREALKAALDRMIRANINEEEYSDDEFDEVVADELQGDGTPSEQGVDDESEVVATPE